MSHYDPETKIWSSNNRTSIYNPKTSVGEILLYGLERTPDKICEISDDYESFLTCFEVRKRSIQVAESLKRNYGVKFGDVCAVVSKNNPEVSAVAFGCLFIGAPLNTLDPSFDQIDFDHMFGLTRPKVIFAESSTLEKIQRTVERLDLVTKIFCFTSLGGTITKGFTSVASLFDNSIVYPAEEYLPVYIPDTTKHIALIVCSSGTTGLSKGVCLSHAQVVSQTLRFWPMHGSDTTFAFSSLYWITGIMTLFKGVSEGAIRINTCKPFTPAYFLGLVEKHRITHTFMPPSLIAQCLESKELGNADLSSLRRCFTGGSFVLEDLRVAFEKHLGESAKVIQGYGMSEIGSSVSFNWARKPGSVGVLVYENEIKVISEEGEPLGPGETGEICMRQPYPFLGYYGDEEAYKAVMDSQGWIHSGDLGYFDKEGYLFIVGRKKELIKYRNHQIAPGSIEIIIQAATGLSQICAVAIEEHQQGTDLPAAVIVRPSDFPLTETEIIKILDDKLDDIRKLRGGIYFVEKLALTASGKVLRRKVKELANKLYHERKQM